MQKLTRTPEHEFRELDGVVVKNLSTAVAFLKALAKIHDEKLYKQGGYATWQEYCDARRVSRVHGLRLVKAVQVQKTIEGKCNPGVAPVTVERHLREIGQAPEPLRPAVVEEAQKRASDEGRDVTARDYREAVQSVTEAATEAPSPVAVYRRDAAQPESYVDEEGYPVPDSLYEVWRDIPAFMEVSTKIRYSGCHEAALDLQKLGAKHRSPAVIQIGNKLEKMHREMWELALTAKPVRVDGENWYSKAEIEN